MANIQPRNSQRNTLSLGLILSHLSILRHEEETGYCHPAPWDKRHAISTAPNPPDGKQSWHLGDVMTLLHMAAEDAGHLVGSEVTLSKRGGTRSFPHTSTTTRAAGIKISN